MQKKEVLVLEIGSLSLRALVAKEGVNDTLLVKEFAKKTYDGFYQGEFVDFSRLAPSLFDLFSSLDYKKKKYNKKLCIALPAELSKATLVSANIDIESAGKITANEVMQLRALAIEKVKDDEVEVISTSPLFYDVDGIKSTAPLGKKGRSFSGEFSIITCKRSLIEKLNTIFADLGFYSVEYLSEPLASALMVTSEEERSEGAIVIDVGHLTTSVTYVKGDGIFGLTSFSIGGGHITVDLCEAFDLTYADAENLKSEVVVSVEAGALDYYDLPTAEGKIERIPQLDANKVVSYRLETIASAIHQCLMMQGVSLSSYLPIYLIGAGAAKVKGGKDFIAKCISKNITFGRTRFPGKDKPDTCTIYAIADYALKNCD